MGSDALDGTTIETGPTPEGLATLAALGVSWSPSFGEVTFRNDWAIVGAVILAVAGGIEVVPRTELMQSQVSRLLAAATRVCLLGKAGLQGWKWVPALGWVALVGMRYPGLLSLRRRESSSSMSSSAGAKPLVLAGLSAPSAR